MPKPLPSDLERLYVRFLDALASPVAMVCKDHVKYRRWDDLVSIRVDPLTYSHPEDYFRDVAAVDFLRKCKDLDTSFERETVAESNFVYAEQLCKRTNLRLETHFLDNDMDRHADLLHTPEGACSSLIAEARKEISRILGKAPSDLKGQFGPGATYGDKGSLTTIPDKMTSRPTLTPDSLWWLFPWSSTMWGRAVSLQHDLHIKTGGYLPEVVRGNRFTTVPKDCTKDRGIAVEPSINLFYQLSLGKAIRSRLLSAGINLQEGQDIHRRFACEASKHGCFATLDLSNASDTVCSNLVKLLLPAKWFNLLDSLRSPFTLFKGKWVKLEKFSSMGNGFTFELETLIFLGIILAVRNLRSVREPLEALVEPGRDVFVYGDDLIIPTDWASDVVSALTYLGFEVNRRKSFVTGSFRESCGGDYFGGVDVRPFYLKEFPNEPQQWITIANGIRKMAIGNDSYHLNRRSLFRSWVVALDSLPSHIRRLRGPDLLGDLVIHDEREKWQTRKRGSLTYISVYKPAKFRVIGWQHWRPDVGLAAILYVHNQHSASGVIPRDGVLGYRVGWVPLPPSSSRWLPPTLDELDASRERCRVNV